MLRWRSYPVLLAGVLVLVLALSRCGKEEDDKEGDPKPAGSTSGTGAPTGGTTTGAGAPTGWDGKTDWTGSAWEVIEE